MDAWPWTAGKTAGLLALASWTSTLFFPLVVLGAGAVGPRLGAAAEAVTRAMSAVVMGWNKEKRNRGGDDGGGGRGIAKNA